MNMIEEYEAYFPSDAYEPDFERSGFPRFDDLPVQVQTRGTTQPKKETKPQQRERDYQALLWTTQTTHKNTIAAKLREYGRRVVADDLEACHSRYTIAQCSGCLTVKKFPNRCDRFYCPECQPRLAKDRQRSVEWWTKLIKQPKHVVLTVKNVPNLNSQHVREFKKWFTNLRRSKFAKNWSGGFYSLEVTNEGRGWHLHLHALINARFIDQYELSTQWERVTNGMGRIVAVRDAREKNYLSECLKYTVKGNQLAAWTGETIATFIDAFSGVRTFGVFGDLYGKRTEFAEWLNSIRDSRPPCDCGCDQINYFSEAQWLAQELRPAPSLTSLPPPSSSVQKEFGEFADRPLEIGPR